MNDVQPGPPPKIKTVITLILRSAAAAEDLTNSRALLILDRQMRDAQDFARAQRATSQPGFLIKPGRGQPAHAAMPAHHPLDQAHWKL